MKPIRCWLFLVFFTSQFTFAQDIETPVRSILFKITATTRSPDFFQPWNKYKASEVSGTGFLIAGNRILTNAHVVRYATQIYVQADQSDQRIAAEVVSSSQSIDLAVLKLEDESVLSDRTALQLQGNLPRVRSDVTVYGYPIGGDQLSVTKGIVSRVEYVGAMLRTQIDAAINPGNSGGPAISDGKVVGVAFSGLKQADNIGYLIPSTEVNAFLDDVADNEYTGRPTFWDSLQTVENPALRTWLGLPKTTGGLMVSSLQSSSPDNPLQVGDVITKLGPHAIDSKGLVKVGDSLNLSFRYYIPELIEAGKLPVTVWRKGVEKEVKIPVEVRPPLLMAPLDGSYPRFAIIGPLAFEAVSGEFSAILAQAQGSAQLLSTRGSPLIEDAFRWKTDPDQELVVIPSPPFAHRLMKGYSPPFISCVKEINGTKVRNLKHLVELIRDCKDEFLTISFYDRSAEILVFNRAEYIESTEDILTDNNIRKQFSDDLETVWRKK